MADRNRFYFYFDWRSSLNKMKPEKYKQFVEAILDYAQFGTLPDWFGDESGIDYAFVKPYERIAADFEKYVSTCKKNAENIEKRWRGDSEQNDTNYTSGTNGNDSYDSNTSGNDSIPLDTDIDLDLELDIDLEREVDSETDKEKETKSENEKDDTLGKIEDKGGMGEKGGSEPQMQAVKKQPLYVEPDDGESEEDFQERRRNEMIAKLMGSMTEEQISEHEKTMLNKTKILELPPIRCVV